MLFEVHIPLIFRRVFPDNTIPFYERARRQDRMTHCTATPQSSPSLTGTSQGIDRLWVVRMMALDDLGRAATLALLHEQTAFWMLRPHITGITGPQVSLWTCTALVLGQGVIRCMMGVFGFPGFLVSAKGFPLALLSISYGYSKSLMAG